jgi:hypothetical protein
MKLDLLTNATVVDDAIKFVSDRLKEKQKLSNNNNENEEEDKLEERTRAITASRTTNEVF